MENQEKESINQLAKQTFRSGLVKITDTYTNMIIGNFQNIQLELDAYQKVCLANAIAKIQELLACNDLDFKSDAINQNNLTTILSQIAMFRLNPAASPRECYFQLRNDTNHAGKKIIEFGIEGNGNDAILRNYGVDVVNVSQPIIIREGDEFTYPYFDGDKMQPFTWKPKSFYKKPIAVVYIVTKKDGSKEYLVSEREAVANNLKAHISNNMLTCKDYKLKKRILEKIQNMSLEEMLADSELTNSIKTEDGKYLTLISPAWKSAHSKEAMILRKMQNNAIKKYPKDFKNSYVESEYESTFDDYNQYKEGAITMKSEEFTNSTTDQVAQQQLAENGSIKPTIHAEKEESQVNQPQVNEETGETIPTEPDEDDDWLNKMSNKYDEN